MKIPHAHRIGIGTSAVYTTSKFAGKKSVNFENRQKRTLGIILVQNEITFVILYKIKTFQTSAYANQLSYEKSLGTFPSTMPVQIIYQFISAQCNLIKKFVF